MKRFKITLLVPQTKEIVVADAQAAHNEASRLANGAGAKAIVSSIEFIENVETELDLGNSDPDAA